MHGVVTSNAQLFETHSSEVVRIAEPITTPPPQNIEINTKTLKWLKNYYVDVMYGIKVINVDERESLLYFLHVLYALIFGPV